MTFSPNGSTLATADDNGATYLWNMTTHQPFASLNDPHQHGVYGVVFSPDSSMLATADGNTSTYIWSVATQKIIDILQDPHGSQDPQDDSYGVNGVDWSRDDQYVAVADANGISYLWDAGRITL